MGLAQRNEYFDGRYAVMKKKEMIYTVADIENLPEGERAELIDGTLYMMATPTATHQDIAGFIYSEFRKFVKAEKGGCKTYIAPYAVYLDETNNYVEPDVVVVCKESKMDEKGCHGAPDLVVEVVSQTSVRMDYVIKLFKYRTYGVREYWIVDYEKKRIQVYDLANDDLKEYTFEDEIPVGIYEGKLTLNFKEL